MVAHQVTARHACIWEVEAGGPSPSALHRRQRTKQNQLWLCWLQTLALGPSLLGLPSPGLEQRLLPTITPLIPCMGPNTGRHLALHLCPGKAAAALTTLKSSVKGVAEESLSVPHFLLALE